MYRPIYINTITHFVINLSGNICPLQYFLLTVNELDFDKLKKSSCSILDVVLQVKLKLINYFISCDRYQLF